MTLTPAFALVVVALLAPGLAAAQPATPQPATPPPSTTSAPDDPLAAPTIEVGRLVGEALARHPRLQAAERMTAAAEAQVEAEGYWPWPMLEVALTPMAEPDGRRPIFQRVSLMQPLAWSATLDAETARAQAAVTGSQARRRVLALELGRAVRRAAADLQRLEAEQAVVARLRAHWGRLVDTLQDRLAVGSARQTEVLMAQVEVARLANEETDLAQRQAVARALLNTLLTRPTDAPLPSIAPPPQMPPEAVDELLAWVQKHHPSLAEATAQIAERRAGVAVADTRGRPTVTVGVELQLMAMGYSTVDISPSSPGVMFMAGTNLPLWGGGVEAGTRAARAAAHAAEAAHDDRARALAFDVLEQHVRVESALRRIALFDDAILPLARQSLAVTETAYGSDQASVTLLLEAQRALERYEIERVQAEAELAVALADLRFAVGRPDRPARRPAAPASAAPGPAPAAPAPAAPAPATTPQPSPSAP